MDYYCQNYFLDPKGSNIDLFINASKKILEKVLSWYTQSDIEINIEQVKIKNKTAFDIKINNYKPKKILLNELKDVVRTIGVPEKSHTIDETIDSLDKLLGNEIKFNYRFMGQQHAHDNIASFVAGIAAKFINGNTIVQEVSPMTTLIEEYVVQSLAKEFGFNPETSWLYSENEGGLQKTVNKVLGVTASGNITVGGTTANFSALLVARNKAYIDKSTGVSEEGLFNKQKGVIFGSEYSHYSLEKLAGFLGMGSNSFKKIKTTDTKVIADNNSSLKTQMWDAAKKGKKVVAVVATAGVTEMGTVDDIEGIANLIDDFEKEFKYRPHYHIDAAHGGGFVLSEKFNPKNESSMFKGIERADSITIDPHKMLYTHYSAGCILFKDKKDHSLLKQSASYLFKENGEKNFGEFRVEGSMGLEGTIQTFASLYALGKEGYSVIFDHVLNLTNYLYKSLNKETNFEVLNKPDTNLLCFRYYNPLFSDEVNDDINMNAQKIMYSSGNAYFSNDSFIYENDKNTKRIEVFRACIMHPYTKKKDIDFAINELKRCVDKAKEKFNE